MPVICQTRIKPDVGLNVLFLKYSLEVLYRLIMIFFVSYFEVVLKETISLKKAFKIGRFKIRCL